MAAFVPPGVVTNTLAVPALPDGVVQVRDVEDTTLTLVQVALPSVTEVAFVKPVPVTVMLVPPEVAPSTGVTEVTVGTLIAKPRDVATYNVLAAANTRYTINELSPSAIVLLEKVRPPSCEILSPPAVAA